MARYIVERNYVQVVGQIWMPSATTAMEYMLSARDVADINEIADLRAANSKPGDYVQDEITREDVAEWLTTHSGDFQSVTDFNASIGDTDIDWDDEENAFIYNNCVYGDEE